MRMRAVVVTLLGLIGGFVAGIVVSDIIGIAGVLLFDDAVEIKYLSLYFAVAGAVAASVLDGRVRRRTNRSTSTGRQHEEPS
jgi:hypothetical protein